MAPFRGEQAVVSDDARSRDQVWLATANRQAILGKRRRWDCRFTSEAAKDHVPSTGACTTRSMTGGGPSNGSPRSSIHDVCFRVRVTVAIR